MLDPYRMVIEKCPPFAPPSFFRILQGLATCVLDTCCVSNQWYAFNTFCRMATDDMDLAPAVLRAAEVRIPKFRPETLKKISEDSLDRQREVKCNLKDFQGTASFCEHGWVGLVL